MNTRTFENLREAFAGESQANRRYIVFADKAEKDGFPQVARLFRAAAAAETVHARNHLQAMKGVGATKENLDAAIKGEHAEFVTMYPTFIDQAKSDKFQEAEISFAWANKVEQIHHSLYQKALADLGTEKSTKGEAYFVCQTCGNTVLGAAPATCPICGRPANQFLKVE